MVEYSLVLIMISIVAVVALTAIGGILHNTFGTGFFDQAVNAFPH